MENELAKSAQTVQEVLSQRGLDCKVVELPDVARTAVDAANALNCDVAQIVKSLIFKTKDTHKPVLLLVSGPNRVNESIVESLVAEPIIKADANFAREITGFAIGGIPPVGHKQQIDHIYIDEDLMKFESLWAAAGTPYAVFNMRVSDLLKLTKGKIIQVC